jgi:hypothetical protein
MAGVMPRPRSALAVGVALVAAVVYAVMWLGYRVAGPPLFPVVSLGISALADRAGQRRAADHGAVTQLGLNFYLTLQSASPDD